jgi:hypothetical protein
MIYTFGGTNGWTHRTDAAQRGKPPLCDSRQNRASGRKALRLENLHSKGAESLLDVTYPFQGGTKHKTTDKCAAARSCKTTFDLKLEGD